MTLIHMHIYTFFSPRTLALTLTRVGTMTRNADGQPTSQPPTAPQQHLQLLKKTKQEKSMSKKRASLTTATTHPPPPHPSNNLELFCCDNVKFECNNSSDFPDACHGYCLLLFFSLFSLIFSRLYEYSYLLPPTFDLLPRMLNNFVVIMDFF